MIAKKCEKLANEGIAYIYKIPTDWCIQRGVGGRITSAFPRKKSICDFLGSYKGQCISLEAKECTTTTSYSIKSNIHEHQVEFMNNIHNNGGLTYYIIHFKTLSRAFLIQSQLINTELNNGMKSLKLQWFIDNGKEFDIKTMDFDKYIEM